MLNRSTLTTENQLLLERVREKQWKSPAERDELLRQVSALKGFSPDDVSEILVDADPAVRAAGLAILESFPKDSAGASLLFTLTKQPEAAQRKTFEMYVATAGGDISPDRFAELIADRRLPVVTAAIDWVSDHPNPKYLTMLSIPLSSGAPAALRRKALVVAEKIGTPLAAKTAAVAVEDEDEEVRFRAVGLVAKFGND
jgi:hypothetical protein